MKGLLCSPLTAGVSYRRQKLLYGDGKTSLIIGHSLYLTVRELKIPATINSQIN